MAKFKVMVASEEELAKEKEDRKYKAVGTEHCKLEAVNEMVAQARHREGIFDKKYPRHSWVEVDEQSDLPAS